MNLESTEYQEHLADAALGWIDTLPDRIAFLLTQGAYNHNLNIPKIASAKAMAEIRDALTDLFYKDRNRLMEITGYMPSSFSPPVNSKDVVDAAADRAEMKQIIGTTAGERFLNGLNHSIKGAL